jgi:hypothetical protein
MSPENNGFPQALTRRELRERERAAAPASEAPGASAATPSPAGGNTYVPSAPTDAPFQFSYPPSAPGSAPTLPRAIAGVPIATRQSKASSPRIARTIGSRLLSLGALVFAGALAFGMSVPANAFYTPSSALPEASLASDSVLQSVEVAANVEGASAARDSFKVLSWAEVLKERYGTRSFSYNANGMGPVRWPFPQAVPISSGFGERVAPCRGCSSHHMGLDFNPGNGAAIFAIADGVVTLHQEDQWGFGNHVMIRHVIDGHDVISTYAHMQYGSSPLNPGDVVKVGDFVGLVGATGTATGAHLHFEITLDGMKVDPFAFLKSRTG